MDFFVFLIFTNWTIFFYCCSTFFYISRFVIINSSFFFPTLSTNWFSTFTTYCGSREIVVIVTFLRDYSLNTHWEIVYKNDIDKASKRD
ncbi:hypothetical protein WKT22_01851 [Candidatus Lokiarchaeum ossiferum]